MGKVYAAILAGGSGTRMGNPDKPKQFWDLAGKPVLVHTVEKFCMVGEFAEIAVLAPESWLAQTADIVKRHLPQFADRIAVVAGGPTRNETVACALAHIQDAHGIGPDDILVTHDAVRPFVSLRIIEENIAAAREQGACDTVVPATDTIVHSTDGVLVTDIPMRAEYYQGQTPQSFNALRLKEVCDQLTESEKAQLTDACKIFVLRGLPVALVRGDAANMKLTYAGDMRVARALVAAEGEVDAGGSVEAVPGGGTHA